MFRNIPSTVIAALVAAPAAFSRAMVRRLPSPALVVSLLALFVSLGGVGIAATGANFILGRPNTATTPTELSGSSSGVHLNVTNSSAGQTGVRGYGAGLGRGVWGESPGSGVVGQGGVHGGHFSGNTGVRGISPLTGTSGYGIWGSQAGTGSGVYGTTTGLGRGVFGDSPGTGVYGQGGVQGGIVSGPIGAIVSGAGNDGLRASTTALNRSAVWAHHDGTNYGFGLFAESANGPAVAMRAPATAAPMILNGEPFPRADLSYLGTAGLPRVGPSAFTKYFNVPAGNYLIIAKANAEQANIDWPYTQVAEVRCTLRNGADSAYTSLGASNPGRRGTVSVIATASFAQPDRIAFGCSRSPVGGSDIWISEIRIAAIRLSAVTGG